MERLDYLDMIRPPVNRALKQLDRSLFSKTLPLSVARIPDFTHIPKIQKDLGDDAFHIERLQRVISLPKENGRVQKGILLRPEIKADDGLTWTPMISELVKSHQIDVLPHPVTLNYDYWDYYEVMNSILPAEEGEDVPSSWTSVGHIAHLNLREKHLPYKYIVAQVLMDKIAHVKTVINKIENVGSVDEFRTFEYEVLAGRDNMIVTLNESGCTFSFDYSKVYWNSRLNTEHERVVSLFNQGEAICDVMAGVGPFAAPAGKKGCWVFANDLNPQCYKSLKGVIKRNKIENCVQAFNEDGVSFIRTATDQLLNEPAQLDVTPPIPRSQQNDPRNRDRPRKIINRPAVFSHYVLNLPATAITFLPSFIGLYAGKKGLFKPNTDHDLPLIHVYCFSKQMDDDEANKEICNLIGKQLGFEMTPADGIEDGEGKVHVMDVRLVAPHKRYFCASFRLPSDVAFRKV